MNPHLDATRRPGLRRTALFSLTVWLVAACAFGAEYDGGLLDVGEVVKAAAGVTRERFPNADDVLVDDYIKAV